jgi:NADH:ubiquinone oxidoreductase subunit 2 (subunit N)
MGLLSLGGLPPFLGFPSKCIITEAIVLNSLNIIITHMAITPLINVYYYLRSRYSSFIIIIIIMHTQPKLNAQTINVLFTAVFPRLKQVVICLGMN